MFEFIPNEKIIFPWISISRKDDKIILTTKKIASRFFEDISRVGNTGEGKKRSIDFRIEHTNQNTDFTIKNKMFSRVDDDLSIDPTFSISEFLDYFNIKSIKDFFSIDYFQNNKIYIITRNPIDRFYTGFFENVDYLARHDYSAESLKDESQENIDSILNNYTKKIDYTFLSDAHTSLWNTFIFNFLSENHLLKYITIVDLNHVDIMNSTFGYLDQPSNKKYLTNWLSNPNNKEYIDILHNNLQYYFELELKNYNKLLNMKNIY